MTLPATVLCQIALYQTVYHALSEDSGIPTRAFVLGHSLGEIAAAYAVGRIGSAKELVRLVWAVAKLGEKMDGTGGMAAWQSSREAAQALIWRSFAEAEGDGGDASMVEIAAENTAGDLTLAGPGEAVSAMVERGRTLIILVWTWGSGIGDGGAG